MTQQETTLTALIDHLESQVKQARKAADIDPLLTLTAAAMDQLEQAANDPATAAADRERAQKSAKKLGYNAAADVWPFWDNPPPARTQQQLRAARAIAVRVADLSAVLPQTPTQAGNAPWLIGAFDLALGDLPSAQSHFSAARSHFEPVPEMKLLAEGYQALAGDPAASPLETTIQTLTTSALPHAKDLAEQLLTAAASIQALTASLRAQRSNPSFQRP
jgi:hypothetical protein